MAVAGYKAATEHIKRAVSPAEFYQIELGVSLNRAGWQVAGRCPFHADRHEGSFKIHSESGAYRCFACSASGGDIIAFTRVMHGLSFKEAVRAIASAWGIRP